MTDTEKTVEEHLAETGVYVATTLGVSMFPLLRDKRYAVKLVPAMGRLKKYDIALFRRGKQLVLHRVIRVFPDRYYIRGDNCRSGEYVLDRQIIGVLSEIKGKDRHILMTDLSYIIYSRLIVFFHPLLFLMKRLLHFARRTIGKNTKNE